MMRTIDSSSFQEFRVTRWDFRVALGFHPSRANEFSEFSEKCWKMCGKGSLYRSKKQVFEIRQKTYRFSKHTDFWKKNFPENVFHLAFLWQWKTDISLHKTRLYTEHFLKNLKKSNYWISRYNSANRSLFQDAHPVVAVSFFFDSSLHQEAIRDWNRTVKSGSVRSGPVRNRFRTVRNRTDLTVPVAGSDVHFIQAFSFHFSCLQHRQHRPTWYFPFLSALSKFPL
jgi:hypothetical protein